jgi:ComEC/Rec2-related protein
VIAAALSAAILLGMFVGWPAVPIVVGAALFGGFLLDRWRLGIAASLLVIIGVFRAPDSTPSSLAAGTLTNQQISVSSSVVRHDRYQEFQIRLPDDVRVCVVTFAHMPLGRGDSLLADVEIEPLEALSESYAATLRSRNCAASGLVERFSLVSTGSGPMRFVDDVRSSAARQLEQWVAGDPGALLSGLVVGDDARLTDKTAEAFLATGTFHIVAISGANLTLLIALLAVLTIWLPRPWSELVPLVLVWAYVLVGGAGPPTVRAGVLATIVLAGRLRGRSIDLLTLTVVVAAVQAVIWPEVTLGLSYRLSTVAVIVVILVSLNRSIRGWWRGIALIALISLAVNVTLMPLLPPESRPPLIPAVIANVLIAIPVSLAFSLGLTSLLVGLVIPGFGQALAVIAGEINGITIAIVSFVARAAAWPGWITMKFGEWPTSVILLAALVTLIMASPESRRWIGDVKTISIYERPIWTVFGTSIGAGMLLAGVGIAIVG